MKTYVCLRCSKEVLPDIKRDRPGVPNHKRSRGRSLCSLCYTWARYHGKLVDYPRSTRSRDELLDDYVILRSQGYNWSQCATKLGMSYSAFERAIYRARRARDERALRLNERSYACR
jgi:hypothetical protein